MCFYTFELSALITSAQDSLSSLSTLQTSSHRASSRVLCNGHVSGLDVEGEAEVGMDVSQCNSNSNYNPIVSTYSGNGSGDNQVHELLPDEAGKVSRCFGKRECMPHSLFCFKVWLLNYINIYVFNIIDLRPIYLGPYRILKFRASELSLPRIASLLLSGETAATLV